MSERGGADRPKSKAEIDRLYAERFWASAPEGMRVVYTTSIESAARIGTLSLFANREGIDERDKEKMSALRVLAQELGYEVGQFHLDKKQNTASAPIHKIVK